MAFSDIEFNLMLEKITESHWPDKLAHVGKLLMMETRTEFNATKAREFLQLLHRGIKMDGIHIEKFKREDAYD